MATIKYKPGDRVVCRSDYGVEGLVTPGSTYWVAEQSTFMGLASALGLGVSNESMVTITCNDGVVRSINKLRFVPSTEVVVKKGNLTLLRLRAPVAQDDEG